MAPTERPQAIRPRRAGPRLPRRRGCCFGCAFAFSLSVTRCRAVGCPRRSIDAHERALEYLEAVPASPGTILHPAPPTPDAVKSAGAAGEFPRTSASIAATRPIQPTNSCAARHRHWHGPSVNRPRDPARGESLSADRPQAPIPDQQGARQIGGQPPTTTRSFALRARRPWPDSRPVTRNTPRRPARASGR
jgi:hypothetical protein